MKKLILPFFALLMLFACDSDRAIDVELENATYDSRAATTRGANKVNICHNGHMIRVSVNALPAFLNQGDIVEFGQLGNYRIIYSIGGQDFVHEGEIIQSDDGSFSGSGQSITTGQTWTLGGTMDDNGEYSFTLYYTGSTYTATATGTFACDGSGYSGDWSDSSNQTGTWTAVYLSY